MKTIFRTAAVTLAWTVPVLAANGSEADESGLLAILFLGFGALVLVFQLIPGLVLFGTMLKELFTPAPRKAPATATEESEET